MNGHNPKANQPDVLADDFQGVAALLQELPRVAAPTDFNATLQARIVAAKAEANEFASITALLKELPHVAAPADFNANLQARIASAKVEVGEFAGVTALIKEMPRVAAPADFDFKLRARIAQAKAAEQKAPAGWFAELFGQTFSWLHAGAAMAAVAVIVSMVTFGVLRSEMSVDTAAPTIIAQGSTPAPSVAIEQPARVSNQPATIASQPISVRTNTSVKQRTIKVMNSGATSGTVTGERKLIVPVPTESSTMVASKVMIKHQSGEARMVNLSEYNLGLQTAHLRQAPVTKSNRVESAMANIY